MSDRSWRALPGEAHKRDLSVESAESTQEMGPSPEPLVFVPVPVSSSCSSQPRGALAEAFLEAQLAHLGERVA